MTLPKPHLALRIAMILNIIACGLFLTIAILGTALGKDSSLGYELGRIAGEAIARMALMVLICTAVAIVLWIKDPYNNRKHALITIGCTLLFAAGIGAIAIVLG